MYLAILITLVSVISIVSVIISRNTRKQSVLTIALFSFKFKYLGGALVIISIFLSFFELKEDEFYNNIRIGIANLGLIIMVLSRDKLEFRDSSFIKMACFSLSTIISYFVSQFIVVFLLVDQTIELSQFILDLLIIYIISYHYIKSKIIKSV